MDERILPRRQALRYRQRGRHHQVVESHDRILRSVEINTVGNRHMVSIAVPHRMGPGAKAVTPMTAHQVSGSDRQIVLRLRRVMFPENVSRRIRYDSIASPMAQKEDRRYFHRGGNKTALRESRRWRK